MMTQTARYTLVNEVCAHGPAQDGRSCRVRLRPASPGGGLRVVRRDLPAPLRLHCRIDRARWRAEAGLVLGEGRSAVRDMVPLLAACYALGMDDLSIEMDGPAPPHFDGSAAPWVFLLQCAGCRLQTVVSTPSELCPPSRYAWGEARLYCQATQGGGLRLVVIGRGKDFFPVQLSPEVFVTQLSRARPHFRGGSLVGPMRDCVTPWWRPWGCWPCAVGASRGGCDGLGTPCLCT